MKEDVACTGHRRDHCFETKSTNLKQRSLGPPGGACSSLGVGCLELRGLGFSDLVFMRFKLYSLSMELVVVMG